MEERGHCSAYSPVGEVSGVINGAEELQHRSGKVESWCGKGEGGVIRWKRL